MRLIGGGRTLLSNFIATAGHDVGREVSVSSSHPRTLTSDARRLLDQGRITQQEADRVLL